MSQVRKFQDGGQTEPVKRKVPGADPVVIEQTPVEEAVTTPKSYIIIDGEKFENTEEERQKLRDYFARVADARGGSQVLSQIADLAEKAAIEGGNLTYDTPSNLFSYRDSAGVDQKIDWNNLNDRQDNRLQKQRSWLGRVFDANFNSKVQQSAEDISKLAGYRNFRRGQTQAAATTPTSNLIDILYGGWWEYLQDDKGFVKDENGNLKYNYNSPKNVKLQKQIQNALAALGMTADEAGKHFNWAEGYNGGADLRSLYEADPEGYKTRLQATLDNVVAGRKMTAEDLSILKAFGIDPNDTTEGQTLTEAQKKAAEEQALKDKWTKAGFADIYDKAKDYFDVDDDGVVTLNDNGVATFTPYGFSKTGGYELNNAWLDWVKNEGLDNTLYDFLNGYTIYNGKLYKTSSASDPNSALANIYRTSGYYDKNKSNLYADAQKIINSFWGNKYTWTTPEDTYYSTFSYDKDSGRYRTGRRYRSANGLYTWKGQGDQQIVQYYDEDAARDVSGFVTEDAIKYAITDKYGNVIKDNLTAQDLEDEGITRRSIDGRTINYGDEENTIFNQRELLKSEDPRLNNHYVVSYGDEGSGNAWAVYINPYANADRNNPNTWTVIKMPGDESGYVIPPMFSRILFNSNEYGENGLQRILKDRKAQGYLRDVLEATTKTAMGRIINSSDSDRTIKWLCKYLGVDKETIKEICSEYLDMIRSAQNERKNNYLVNFDSISQNQVPIQKQGGTIRKFQPGGGFGSTKGTAKYSEAKKTKIDDTRDLGKVKDLGKKSLSDSDWADIIGLGADITSLGMTFAPGIGNLAAAGTGLAGSLAGFYSDIKRDGYQGRDLRDLGLNVLMDIGTALPGAGTGAKVGKIARKARKMGQTLLKAASLAGVGSGAYTIAQRVASGQDVTWRDLRTLVNAITAGSNLRKLGGFGKTTKKVTADPELTIKGKQRTISPDKLEIKAKSGRAEDSVFLTKQEVETINALPNSKARNEKLGEIIASKKGWKPTDSDYAAKLDSFDYDGSGIGKINANNVREIDKILMPSAKTVDVQPIKLNKTQIEKINTAKSSAEKEKVLVDIVKKETGDNSFDSIDKVKEAFDVDDLYKSVRKREWSLNPKKSVIGEKVNELAEIKAKGKTNEIEKKASDNSFVNWWRGTGTSKQWFPRRGVAEADRSGYREAFLREGTKPPVESVVRPGYYESVRVVPGNGNNPNNLPAPVSSQANYVPNVQERVSPNWALAYRQLFEKGLGRQHIILQRDTDPATPAPGQNLPENSNNGGNVVKGFKQGGQIQKYWSGGLFNESTINKIGQKLEKVDPADLLEFSKYLVNISNSNKLNKLAKKAYDNVPMKIATQYSVPTFSDNGLLNAGNEQVKEIYNRQPANYTSDAMLNNFVRKANQEKATEYQNKLNTQFATMLNQHNQKTWEIENKNAESRTNTANENNQQRFKTELAKNQMDQATLSANNQSFNNLVTDRIQKLAAKKTAANAAKEKMAGVYNNAEMYKELMNDGRYRQAMDAWNTYHAANPDKTQDEWFAGEGKSYAADYEQALKQAQTKLGLNVYSTSWEDFGPYARGVDRYRDQMYQNALYAGLINEYKKGGKTSDYKAYRDTRDQLWIDQNKAVRQAINQLNKSTQQILLKMLK